ncbi:MAG: protein kinase domain-containing protein [Parvularcula sp.]
MTSTNDQDEAEALRLLDEVLDMPEAERDDWLKNRIRNNSDLYARVRQLMEIDPSDVPLTGGAAQAVLDEVEPAHPERIGNYRIVRLIGRGGMGAVYFATRDAGDFEHQVAIKVIRGLRNTPKLRDRLRAERQTLARLKHPNIAQLFDGGETEAGDPYFIMEYVEGRPLRDGLEERLSARSGDPQEALNIILQVGSAVQYAHQQLIVHHDLSPSNILVTDDGQVKLIDFGISQSLGGEEPSGGSRYTLTKGYAAPERERGEPATTLSDIYSLGVILKELSAGGGFPRQADLDAICAKATATDPADRYEDVGSFLSDVRRYRASRSVPARSTAPTYRARRFVGRHKLSAAAGGVALAALVATSITMSVLFVRAERAEKEASARFDDTRELATSLLTDIFPEVDRVPGARTARRMIAEAGESYLEKLEQTPRATPALVLDRARGLVALGRIMGSPKGGAFDDPDAGERYLAEAIGLLSTLMDETGETPERLLLLGQAYFYSAEIRLDPHGDLDGTFANLSLSEQTLQRGLKIDPDNRDLKRSLLFTQGYRNTPTFRQGDKEAALAINRAAIDQATALLAEAPEDVETLRFLAGQRRAMAEVLTLSSQFEEAIGVLDEALSDLDRLAARDGEDTYLLRGRSIAQWRRAFALFNVGRLDEAATAYDAAIDLVEERFARDPTDMDAAFMRVSFLSEKARTLSALGRYDEAATALISGLEWHEKRLADAPDQQARQRAVAIQHYQLADHFKNTGDDDRRCYHARQVEFYFRMMDEAGQLQSSDRQAWPDVAAEFPDCSLSPAL